MAFRPAPSHRAARRQVGKRKGIGARGIAKLVERAEGEAAVREAAVEPNAFGADFGHIRAGPAITEQHFDLFRRQVGASGSPMTTFGQYLAAEADRIDLILRGYAAAFELVGDEFDRQSARALSTPRRSPR
jgi:hypothetical protein